MRSLQILELLLLGLKLLLLGFDLRLLLLNDILHLTSRICVLSERRRRKQPQADSPTGQEQTSVSHS
jgi:hypothetical protein